MPPDPPSKCVLRTLLMASPLFICFYAPGLVVSYCHSNGYQIRLFLSP